MGEILQRSLRQLSLVLFFDFFTYAGLIPLIPMFILPTQLSIIPASYDLQQRYIILGFLLATYPLTQMIAAPFLGYFSDRYGKKKMLIVSYIGNGMGYVLTALAIYYGEVSFVFLGHAIAGITGCNLSMVQALIGEMGKSTRLGLFSTNQIAIGSGFLIGPLLIGTLLAKFQWSHDVTFYFLFFCVASCICNLLILKKIFINIRQEGVVRVSSWISHIKSLVKLHSPIQMRLLSGLLFFQGWYGFIKLFQAYLLSETDVSMTGIFSIMSYFGLCSLCAQIFLYQISKKRGLSSKNILYVYAILGIGIALCIAHKGVIAVYCGATLFSVAHAILTTTLISRVSISAGDTPQGTVMGLYQTGQSFAKTTAPIISCFLMTISATSSLLCSLVLLGVSALVFYLCEVGQEKTTANS